MSATLRYWAAAKEAAGVAEESCAGGRTLAHALDAALASRPGDAADRLRRVLARCSFLVDGHPVGRRPLDDVVVTEGAVIDVLPPFAGG